MKPLDYDRAINGYDLFIHSNGIDLYEKCTFGWSLFIENVNMNDLSDTTDTDMVKNGILQNLYGETNDK